MPDACLITTTTSTPSTVNQKAQVKGIDRPISPPPFRGKRSATPTLAAHGQPPDQLPAGRTTALLSNADHANPVQYIRSPIQLTCIKDLSPESNADTVRLGEILGDPMIRECWNFNFLFDIDFVMAHFDPDVRALVKVKIVHGFWRRDDERRIELMEDAQRYPDVEPISAYIPDPFGTHHSKMLILFRHDNFAQVIIHTANMISRDWGNMTQAVWRSPLLPLQTQATTLDTQSYPIGSGERFKTDLCHYLGAYEKRLTKLTTQLFNYDFSAIRAAFIGSTPSRQKPVNAEPWNHTSWGWLGLREVLSTIPIVRPEPISTPNIVIQVSSIATLGATPAWLTHFQSVLSRSSTTSFTSTSSSASAKSSFFTKREANTLSNSTRMPAPKFHIIFPTPHEIRTSLDGYNSGASIHTKLQSAAQQKQLQYLLPLLCHWKHENHAVPERRKAERGSAAPHIKTYIRFTDAAMRNIDWAMVTSANLSKQAWGEMENKKNEVWIQSWECGVVVWPALFNTSSLPADTVTMVPVFGKDTPGPDECERDDGSLERMGSERKRVVVGFHMPYDLPLVGYGADEVPWCASAVYEETDWKGQRWSGFQPR
ncbi:tyrosyl-DNA phosphodiesterase I [Massariosphaeria phaeospora]|uniref:Tyrosyl-DNA phosphodiesterase I n=1 Tax=Massariosphaeria phaeospora TaxID=100035 RepID=A0A7C8MK03_9PLEO|nr:tyrosyl-DNA phosphodiesterase I [Massariosphaeria phaeospora]